MTHSSLSPNGIRSGSSPERAPEHIQITQPTTRRNEDMELEWCSDEDCKGPVIIGVPLCHHDRKPEYAQNEDY